MSQVLCVFLMAHQIRLYASSLSSFRHTLEWLPPVLSLSLSVSVLHVCGLCFSICLSSPLLWENPNAKKNNPRAQLKQMPKLPHHQDSNSLPQRTTWTPKATCGCGGRWSKPKKRVHSQMFMVSLKGGFTVSTIRKAVT